jgi:hypothetical protein
MPGILDIPLGRSILLALDHSRSVSMQCSLPYPLSLCTTKGRSQEEPVLVVQEDHTCIDLASHVLRLLIVPSVDIARKAVLGFIGDRDSSLLRLERRDCDTDPKVSSCTIFMSHVRFLNIVDGTKDLFLHAGSEGRFPCAAISAPVPLQIWM